MRICPRCNYHITNDKARFCRKCGLNLEEAASLIKRQRREELRLKLAVLESIKIHKLEEKRKKEAMERSKREAFEALKRREERERLEREEADRQKAERERLEREKAEHLKAEMERSKREAFEALKRREERERLEKEKAKRQKAERERQEKEKQVRRSKRKRSVTRVMSIVCWVISIGLAAVACFLVMLDSRPGDTNIWTECAVAAVVFFLLPWLVWWVLVRWICRGIDKLLGKAGGKKSNSVPPPYKGSQVLFPPQQSSSPFYGPNHNPRRK